MIEQLIEQVYTELGSGYSERVYHNAMEVLLRKHNIPYESERIVPILFQGHTIGNIRADLIVDNETVIELKAVKTLNDGFKQQALNYLAMTGLKKAILVNFPQPLAPCCEIVHLEAGKASARFVCLENLPEPISQGPVDPFPDTLLHC